MKTTQMMKTKVVEYVDGQGNKKKRNISFASDLWPLTKFFFVAPAEFDREDKFIKKNWKAASEESAGTAAEMKLFADRLSQVANWTAEGLKAEIDPWVEQNELRPWNAWRVCLVGAGQGPDMYELAAFLGKEETLKRMGYAIAQLN